MDRGIKKAGRKPTGPEEVRLLPSGAVRLSPDLAKYPYVQAIGMRNGTAILLLESEKGAPSAKRLTYSNKKARSPIVQLLDVLRYMGINPRKAAGLYRGVITESGNVRISIREKI